MSKIEISKGPNFSPTRRAFLGFLGGAVLAPAMGVKNAIAQVLDIEKDEAARRDIIIALQPSYWGRNGYNTSETFRRIITSIGQVKSDFLITNINTLGVDEFKSFRGTSQQIADQMLQAITSYQQTFRQLQKRDEGTDGGDQYEQSEGVNESYIRDITTRELDYMRVTELPVHKEFTNQYGEKYRKTVREIPSDVPDARIDEHFYGNYKRINIPGTYINKSLSKYIGSEIPQNIQSSDTYIKVSIAGGRYYVAIYMNSELKLLSYVSPGKNKNGRRTTSGVVLKKIVGQNLIFNKYRMSGKYDESAMYLSIDIQNGELFHASKLGVDGTGQSHGCIRLPVFYIYGMNEKLRTLSDGKKVIIDIDPLY